MSANNFISITKSTIFPEDAYVVRECDSENGFKLCDIGIFATLEIATDVANKYIRDNEVEYGLDIRV